MTKKKLEKELGLLKPSTIATNLLGSLSGGLQLSPLGISEAGEAVLTLQTSRSVGAMRCF